MNREPDKNAKFQGSIPELYDKHLGPVIFEPYADDLARRASHFEVQGAVLEIACGTGILTRSLHRGLPKPTRLVASDLNQAMIDCAKAKLPDSKSIEWRQADAGALPFDSGAFDTIICQFGFMFVPDKNAAFREARRVLSPGGTLLFNVWGSLADNPFGRIGDETIRTFFDRDPPTFYQVPFGFHDEALLRQLLSANGFGDIAIERVKLETRSSSAKSFATGLVRGNPVSLAIEDRGLDVEKIVEAVTAALVREGGDNPFRSTMQALVVTARAK